MFIRTVYLQYSCVYWHTIIIQVIKHKFLVLSLLTMYVGLTCGRQSVQTHMKTIYRDWNFLFCSWQCYLTVRHTFLHFPCFSALTLWHWNWIHGVICRRLHLLQSGHNCHWQWSTMGVLSVTLCYASTMFGKRGLNQDADYPRIEHVKKLAVSSPMYSGPQNVVCVFVNLMGLGHDHS